MWEEEIISQSRFTVSFLFFVFGFFFSQYITGSLTRKRRTAFHRFQVTALLFACHAYWLPGITMPTFFVLHSLLPSLPLLTDCLQPVTSRGMNNDSRRDGERLCVS